MHTRFPAATLARAINVTRVFCFCLLMGCTLTARAQQQIFFDGFEGANSCAPHAQCPGWMVTPVGGAQGGAQIAQNASASGNASYRIQKTNAVGYIDVALKESFTLQPGSTYTVHMSYHSSNSP